jgi:hypothetical protein
MGEFSEDVVYQIKVRVFKGDEHRDDIERLKETIQRNFKIFFPITIGTAEAKITEIKTIKEGDENERIQNKNV